MEIFGHRDESQPEPFGVVGEHTSTESVGATATPLPALSLARPFEAVDGPVVPAIPFEDEQASSLTRTLARGELSNVIRLASETADRMERDAQEFVRKQVSKLQAEVREARLAMTREREEIERMRDVAERERLDIVSAARAESARIISDAQSRVEQKTRDSEAARDQIIAEAQQRADEIGRNALNEARELREWAQGQSKEIIERAQAGAEMLLQAAGRGQIAVDTVTEIVSQAMSSQVTPFSER